MNIRRLNPQKLLLSKWTAVQPQHKEKHFIVTRLLEPEIPDSPREKIEIEAIYTRRCYILPWRDLLDERRWQQGWR